MNRVRPLAVALTLSMFALSAPAWGSNDTPLARRGVAGFSFQPSPDGKSLTINSVRPGGAIDRAGIKVGDVLLSVNDQPTTQLSQGTEAFRKIAAGGVAKCTIVRDGKPATIDVTLDPQPSEAIEGHTVSYGSVAVPAGYKLRTIVSEPKDAKGKSPAFMFVQGIYCASLDRPTLPQAPDTQLVHAMAKAGFVTMRVDKPGLGDSQGPICGDIDFQTELAGYVAALKQLKAMPNVDPDRVYIFGHSMGGVMAPYMAKEVPVRGAIIYGSLVRTWLEYSLENTRRQSKLFGLSEAEASEAVLADSRRLSPVLVEKKTLGDVWAAHPELKQNDPMYEPTRMFSRHMSFYHQLQDLNIAQAWIDAPTTVLALHGQYDWVAAQLDHELIAALVKDQGRIGTYRELPSTDHGLTAHPSLEDSLKAMGRGKWDGNLPKALLTWIGEVEAAKHSDAPAPTSK